jgi:hypothetical protein
VSLVAPSVWLATLFSFATNKRVSPAPAERAYSAYQTLDDEQKRQVRKAAWFVITLAAKHSLGFLRNR